MGFTITKIAGEVNSTCDMQFMIDSEADLADLPECTSGSIAYTVGFARIWQLSNDGSWVEV